MIISSVTVLYSYAVLFCIFFRFNFCHYSSTVIPFDLILLFSFVLAFFFIFYSDYFYKTVFIPCTIVCVMNKIEMFSTQFDDLKLFLKKCASNLKNIKTLEENGVFST